MKCALHAALGHDRNHVRIAFMPVSANFALTAATLTLNVLITSSKVFSFQIRRHLAWHRQNTKSSSLLCAPDRWCRATAHAQRAMRLPVLGNRRVTQARHNVRVLRSKGLRVLEPLRSAPRAGRAVRARGTCEAAVTPSTSALSRRDALPANSSNRAPPPAEHHLPRGLVK